MRPFISKYKYYLLLVLIFIIAEVFVNPTGNFPLNDDWTYGKSVLLLQQEGKLNIGNFAAMSLFTHIVWGFLFAKTFWFSFTILRISTLVSALVGVFVLNKLVFKITQNKTTAFVASLTLLFNPLYFNLSNTFMTDVNFNTLLLLGVYFAYDFFHTKERSSFMLVFVMSTLLVLVRQFGIILPVCFAVACLTLVEKRWFIFGLALLFTALVYGIFKYYEHYLKGVLPPGASYKFSGNVDPGKTQFWNVFFVNWNLRYKQILLHILVYAFPFTIVFLKDLVRSVKNVSVVIVFGGAFYLTYCLFEKEKFPHGNVFTNMSLGAETFYEALSSEIKADKAHTFSKSFESCMVVVKFVFSGLTLVTLLLGIVHGIKSKVNLLKLHPTVIFLSLVFCAYIFLILITESYFDRYHIPLIAMAIVIFSFLNRRSGAYNILAIIPLICLFYVSVFGTKDYLQLNRTRWQAYDYLKQQKNIPVDNINGGFEVNCWNDGKYTWWSDFLTVESFDYLIQYRKETGFTLYKRFGFQKYFPYKKDTVNIFVKENITQAESN